MASSKITKIVKNYSADFDRRREGLPEIISTVNGHADDIDGLDTRVTALEETNPEIPAHTSADAGKFLGVDADGDLAFDYAPDDELPEYGIADAGKFLGVDAQGALEWADAPDDGLPAYTAADATKILMVGYQGQNLIWTPTPQELPSRSAADIGKILSVYSANGLIWITPPEGVPAHTSADAGKFLGVDNSGNLIWGTAGGGGGATVISLTDATSMPNGPFMADSDDTTFTSISDVVTALQSGADIKVLIADEYNTFGAYPLILSAAQEPGYMIPSGNAQRPVAWIYLFDISASMSDPSKYTWEFRA